MIQNCSASESGSTAAANSHILRDFEKTDFVEPGREIDLFVKGTS